MLALDDGRWESLEDVVRYRDDMIAVVRSSLSGEYMQSLHHDPCIESFREIGTAINAAGTLESNKQVAETLCDYIKSAAEPHLEGRKLTNRIVSVEEYLKRREDNIGVPPMLATIR